MDERELERQLKALANRRRLAIIKLLKKSRKISVTDIAKEIKLSFKSTSRHLAVLLAADIVQREQQNLNAFYSLSPAAKIVAKQIITMC